MKYSIEINHDFKIFVYKHNGIIEMKEIASAWNELLNLKEFSEKGYNLLTDYREGTFNFSIESVEILIDFLNQLSTILNGKKDAIIVDKPHECAISMLVKLNIVKEMNFYVELFTTDKAALDFLIH